MYTNEKLKIGLLGVAVGWLGYAAIFNGGSETNVDIATSPEPLPNFPVTLTTETQGKLDRVAKSIMHHTITFLDMKVLDTYVDGRDIYMGTVPQEWFLRDRQTQDTVDWSILLGHKNSDGTKLKLKVATGWQKNGGQVIGNADGRLVLVNDNLDIEKLSRESLDKFLNHPDTHFLQIVDTHENYRTQSRVDGMELFGHDEITDNGVIERHISDQVRSTESQFDSFVHDFRLPTKYN